MIIMNESKPNGANENNPDLTNLWNRALNEYVVDKISNEQVKEIHDALLILENYNYCQLKFGI